MKRTTKKSTKGKKSPEKKVPSKPKDIGKTATSNGSPKKKATVPNKKRKRDDSDEGDGGEDSYELIGEIVQAPTSGRGTHACTVVLGQHIHYLIVPPGRISQNTFDFLEQMKKPECNDREW
jgi:hypothetical protein